MGRVEPGFLRQVLNLGGRTLDYLAKRAALGRYYTSLQCHIMLKKPQHQDWRARFPL